HFGTTIAHLHCILSSVAGVREVPDHANRFRGGIRTKTCGASSSANRNHDHVSLACRLPRPAWAGVCSLWTVVRDCASRSDTPVSGSCVVARLPHSVDWPTRGHALL